MCFSKRRKQFSPQKIEIKNVVKIGKKDVQTSFHIWKNLRSSDISFD